MEVAGGLSKLKLILDVDDYRRIGVLLCVVIFAAFSQAAGVVGIVPFLAVLSNPEVVETNSVLVTIAETFQFETREDFLFFLGIVSFCIFTFGTAMQAVSFWLIVRFTNSQHYRLSRRLMAGYLRRPYEFFLLRNSSDLAKAVLQETMAAVGGVLLPTLQMVSQFVVALAITAVLIIANPKLAFVVAVSIGGLYGLIFSLTRTWLASFGRSAIEANSQRFRAAGDCFAGAKEIRLLGRERAYLEQYRAPSQTWARVQSKSKLIASLPIYGMEAVAFGGIMLVVLYMMRDGGDIASVLPLLGLYALAGRQLIPAYNKIFSSLAEAKYNLPALEKVIADLHEGDYEYEQLPDVSRETPLQLERSIAFEGVSYRYPGAPDMALSNVTFDVPANSSIGIVGSSGAGKSTLVDILLGLLPPSDGRVCVDGTTLSGNTLRRWQAGLGYVPQHIFLADRTIAENIALGEARENINMEALATACSLANLDAFIEAQDAGYDTVIGDRGVRLSGGQRQRIGIARALYRDPHVLVFDEATSALDNATERSVMQAIDNLVGKKTIILVAHRLSTVKRCDRLLVMDDGRVDAIGSWQQLDESSKIFRSLVTASPV